MRTRPRFTSWRRRAPRARRPSRLRAPTVVLLAVALLAAVVPSAAQTVEEYRLKAGYLYNFLLLTDWPARPGEAPGAPVVVGVLGQDPFGAALDPIAGRDVNGRSVAVRRFPAAVTREDLSACHLLFFGPLAAPEEGEVLRRVAALPLLTVSDAAGFVDRGGMIGFTVQGSRLRFEINRAAAAAAGLGLRSKLLRLAERVVGQ